MTFAYVLGLLATLIALHGRIEAQQQQQKIINLKSISLTEEQNYTNFTLFNFSSYLTLNGERLFRVDLLSGGGDATGRFRLSGNILLVNGVFDREALFEQGQCDTTPDYDRADSCLLNLKLALYPVDSMSLVSLFLLPVYVQDVNDNRPRFPDGVLELTVSENLPARTSLPLEAPTDADSDRYSVNECHIVAEEESQLVPSLFDVYYTRPSRSLQLIINAPLDRENRSSYPLTLLCSDGRFKAKQTIHLTVLDVNDNIPYLVVNSYNLTVPENTPKTNLIRIEAFDLDQGPNGRLTYALTNTHDGLFRIDPSTGWISLTGEGLDYERVKRVSLRVRVEDMGLNSVPVYADVLVNVLDLNDNSPGCQLTYSNRHIVAENRTNSTVWIVEHLLNDTNTNHTPLNLAYLSLYDADSAPINGFALSATLISVSYVNTTTLDTLQENLNESTFRLVPIIQDLNNYYYGLQLVRQVDRESALHYDLLVKLADNNRKFSYFNLRIILVDINDNRPVFGQPVYRFRVRENELVVNFGHVEAWDADTGANSRLEYKILDDNDASRVGVYLNRSYVVDSDPNFLFYVNPDNGSLSLRGELDRERKDVYVFTVQVGDGRYTNEALVEVTLVDVNDNQPVFDCNEPAVEFQLDENQPPQSLVGNVLARDPDLNSTVEYSFEPAEIARYFRVDSSNGNLLTRTTLDAETHTQFDFTVTARDPTLPGDLAAARLNVTVYLNDLNDNPPQIVNPPPNGLVNFDLADYYTNKTSNCLPVNGTSNVNVFTLSSTDADRDSRRFNRRHAFKFAFIRRLSWPFVYEIVKSELDRANRTTATNQTFDMSRLVETLVQMQAKHDVKPVAKVNLRSVFGLEADSAVVNQVNVTLNQLCKLNWGVYNVSVQVTDDGGLYAEYPVKLFVYNSNLLPAGVNLTGLSSVNALVERWWAVNANLLAGLKRRVDVAVSGSNFSRVADDNGDYIDGITQEYYKFYASSAFSKFNTGHGGVLVALKNLIGLKLSPSSSSIILLIAGFVFVSLLLLAIITYKHYRTTSATVKSKQAKRTGRQKFVVNLNTQTTSADSSSSFNISDLSLKQQSTKDLSASPNLAASKFTGGKKLTNLKTSTSSSSSSSSSSTSTSNLILYPSSQQQKLLKQSNSNHNQATSSYNHNPTNEQSRYVQAPLKCLPEHQVNPAANSSICDSFTVITSLTNNGDNISTSMSGKNLLVRQPNHQPASCISESESSASPNESSSLTTTVYLNNNATSTPTVLSTFSPLPTAANVPRKPELAASAPTTDAGYYGSSDYSDNNSLVKQEQHYLRQIKQQQQHGSRVLTQVAGQYPPPVAKQPQQQPPATNSTSSFGSSLLSSPSSSTDSTSSSSDFIQKSSLSNTTTTSNSTPVTNLYPGNVNIYQTAASETSNNPNDVKTYLEKFERIYNSESAGPVLHQHQHQHHNHLNTFNSNLNTKHRNSMTTYSYV